MSEPVILTWQHHIDVSADHFAQGLANKLRVERMPQHYDPTYADVREFLTAEVVAKGFLERLEGATELSVQWGDKPGQIVAVFGVGIDLSARAKDLDAFNDMENNVVEAFTDKILPKLRPMLATFS